MAISDVSVAGLDETASLLAGRGADAQRAELDASDRVAVGEYAAVIASTSASCTSSTTTGIAFSCSVLETEYADYERLFAVNLWGVIHGTKAFLPRGRFRRQRAICRPRSMAVLWRIERVAAVLLLGGDEHLAHAAPGLATRADSRTAGTPGAVKEGLTKRVIDARLGFVTNGDRAEKVIESIHSSDGLYCVDVISTPHGFTLQTCRRDEGRWHVISRLSEHRDRGDAVASARALIATFE